jgi:hypothetical protein
MLKKFQAFIDSISSHITLWQIFWGGTMTFGAISGALSFWVEKINQFGWFGWWTASLSGAAIFAIMSAAASYARFSWIRANVIRKWGEQTASINPFDEVFNKQRILVSDLRDPISREITNKKIIDCDLIGPACLLMHGKCSFTRVTFSE